jgi:hypothetical protein
MKRRLIEVASIALFSFAVVACDNRAAIYPTGPSPKPNRPPKALGGSAKPRETASEKPKGTGAEAPKKGPERAPDKSPPE